jgi:Uma2 family endonuclease
MLVAIDIKRWTLDELHSLPDDGNKYEVVRGVLFVTPAPTWQHESILAALSAALSPYVVANGLGLVYHPRAVLRFEDSRSSQTSWFGARRARPTRIGPRPRFRR